MAEGFAKGTGVSSNVNAGNRRPLLKDLHNHVLLEVADKWEDLGVQLLLPIHQGELRVIAADHPNDARNCCKCVLKKWLDTTPNATWNQLIRALRSIQLGYLAGQLEQMLIEEFGQSTASSGECSNICKLTSIVDIEVEFAMMTDQIKQALISSNVDVVALIEQLCAISAVSDKNVPLFDKDVFEKMKSINEFWRELRIFWNIFDYDVLRFIVKVSRCKEAQVILDEFLSRIDPSLIEDVDLVLHCKVKHKEGSLKPVLRIKVNAEKCTTNIQKKIKKTVSENFNLQKYSLCFIGIKKGCIELLYYVSNKVVSHFLQCTIDKNILAGLSFCNIISLHINKHVLKVPHKITDIVAAWSVDLDSQQEIRKPGLTFKLSRIAVIIANSYKVTPEVTFGQLQLRYLPSSVRDAQKMREALEYLNFITIIKYDVTQPELLSFLSSLAYNFDVQICHRFVFAFYGHIKDDIVYCQDRIGIQLSDILDIISNHDLLMNIPRIFFFDVNQLPRVNSQNIEKWQPTIDNVLVAFSTAPGSHRHLNGRGNNLWTDILARKLVTSSEDIYSIIVKTNLEITESLDLQQPQVFGKLSTTVDLLSESGNSPYHGFLEIDPLSPGMTLPRIYSGKSPYHGFLEIDPLSPRMTLPRRFDIYSGMRRLSDASSLADPKFMQSTTGHSIKKATSQLNELFQKYGVTDAKYSSNDDVTDGNVHSFRATLTYTVHGRNYKYESRGVFGRKQDSKEDAAQQALNDLERQLKQPRGVSYKQLLKERYCDKRQFSAPQYTTQSSSQGFVSTVDVPQYKPVTGPVGSSKKEAEQLAAMEALKKLNLN